MAASTASFWRWFAVFILGVIVWFLIAAVAGAITLALTGNPETLTGMALGLLGIIRLVLLLPAFYFILRLVGRRLADMGLAVPARWRQDAALGAAVGVIWPALQFLVFIPLTGGLGREDVVASRADRG